MIHRYLKSSPRKDCYLSRGKVWILLPILMLIMHDQLENLLRGLYFYGGQLSFLEKKKQILIARSSAKFEYNMAQTTIEMSCVKGVLESLGIYI